MEFLVPLTPTRFLPWLSMGICQKQLSQFATLSSHRLWLGFDQLGQWLLQGDGIFIAPVYGVYAFHFSVCVIHGPESPWASLELTRNGNAIGSNFKESKSSGYGAYHCSSTLVISDVDVGDHIFIRTNQATRGPIHSGGGGKTSFSGWLLFR